AERMRASGSLRTAIANNFVPNQDRERLTALARGYWEYPPSALYPDVKPALKALATQFQLGLVANSGEAALKALRRDGLQELFTVVALADFVGVEKPDERIFRYALETAGVSPSRARCTWVTVSRAISDRLKSLECGPCGYCAAMLHRRRGCLPMLLVGRVRH